MKNLSYLFILFLLSSVTLSSCFKEDYNDPPLYSDAELDVNKSILDLKVWFADSNFNSEPKTVTEDWIVEGIVTSADKEGNIYKQIYIQDATAGICISIDANNTYVDYPKGRKVYLKLKGLTLGTYGGLVQVGYEIDETYSPAGVFRIPTTIVPDHIFKGKMVGMPDPKVITNLSQLTDSVQSMYIQLQDIEIADSDLGATYADAVAQQTKNRSLKNCSNQTIVLRNSGYASFAGVTMPRGKGNAYGIFSVFNGTLQLMISDTTALSELSGIRCDGTDPNANYLLDENFEGSSLNSPINGLNGWTSVSEEGTTNWVGGSYDGTKFAKISAYNSGDNSAIAWMISPQVDVTGLSTATLTFKTLEGYDNGAELKLMYSTDYTGDGMPQNATWTDLPASIAGGTTNGYNPNWTPSGDIDLSQISDKLYLAWRYEGSDPDETTTFEVDNVKLIGD